jgi:hypothetical protein
VLGLVLMKKLEAGFIDFGASNKDWSLIVCRYLHSNRDLLECKTELIEKGFGAYAKL